MMQASILTTDFVAPAWHAIAHATLMLTVVGLTIALLFRHVAVDSWRLRCWLLSAVLLQGVMLYRAPIHLGWIQSQVQPQLGPAETTTDAEWGRKLAPTTDASDSPAFGLSLSESAAPAQDWRGWSWWICAHSTRLVAMFWFTTTATMIVLAGLRYLRLLRVVQRLEAAPPSWQLRWENVVNHSRRKNRSIRTEMLVSRSVGPLVVRRPSRYALIVPEGYWRGLSDAQRTGVMLHEWSHIQRCDVWRQLAARMIATLHWFNPIAWWALREYEQAAEVACDHRVACHGRAAAAGFASALVELVQWHQRRGTDHLVSPGMGFQAMATPPLHNRITRLLQSPSPGDSLMKRILLTGCVLALTTLSLVQIRLTSAQDSAAEREVAQQQQLRVVSEAIDEQLTDLSGNLRTDDPTTKRFAELIDSTEGKLAISGLLNQLTGSERSNARVEAVPRFLSTHFTTTDDGRLSLRPEHAELTARWSAQSQRLADHLQNMKQTTDSLAPRMDTSSDAGGLFRRLLEDPEAPAAILLFEMEHGGDVIGQFVSEALGKILVDRGDGTFQIVPSRREDAEKLIRRFEMSGQVSQKLKPQLAVWAGEFDDSDDQHRELIDYLNNPLMATVLALQLTDDKEYSSPSSAAEELSRRLEAVSEDTAAGLRIDNDDVWKQFSEIYLAVDRAAKMSARVGERLGRVAATLSPDDPLSARFSRQMRLQPAAVLIAAELPYAEADPGAQLRATLDQVMTETNDNQLKIHPDREAEITDKAKQLLHVCREIRRHLVSVDEMLGDMQDQAFVDQIGAPGRYLMLSEVRRFVEAQRTDPIELLTQRLLVETDEGGWQVRADRRDVVRRLVVQSELVVSEAGKDDF
jgi:beta-lactamase regulating signal transducer with metallopeptidase domain